MVSLPSERIVNAAKRHTKEETMEGVMFTAREKEILRKMDAHHREGGTSPFIARAQGKLSQVAEEMKVPVDKLDQFLDTLNRSVLPTDYLMG